MSNAKQKHSLARNIEGIIAISFWAGCFLVVWWYQHGGFWTYWKYGILIAVSLSILSVVSQRARKFLTVHVPNALGWIFDIYEEKSEWAMYFILALVYAGIVYFLLAAPYGILCYLGLKVCGK